MPLNLDTSHFHPVHFLTPINLAPKQFFLLLPISFEVRLPYFFGKRTSRPLPACQQRISPPLWPGGVDTAARIPALPSLDLALHPPARTGKRLLGTLQSDGLVLVDWCLSSGRLTAAQTLPLGWTPVPKVHDVTLGGVYHMAGESKKGNMNVSAVSRAVGYALWRAVARGEVTKLDPSLCTNENVFLNKCTQKVENLYW